MKNKTGLSFLLSFLLLIFFQINAFAEQPQFSFSFTPQAGFLNGKIIENVWYANEKITPTSKIYTPADKMSRLDWYMENVPFVGAELDFLFNNKYSFLFSFKNAFAGDCGKMEDFDWLNPIDWPKDPADELTNYSKHTNILHNYTQATINFGRHFYLGKNKNISLIPRFGFQTETISFSGFGGWMTYKTYNWKIMSFEETDVISYKQTFIAPILSFNADFNFARYFEINTGISAVWISTLNCCDIHHVKKALYNDRIKDAWKLGAELAAFFKINQLSKVGFKGDVSYIPDAYGFTYSSETAKLPSMGVPPSLGGTSRFMWSYSISLSLHL